MDPVGASRLAIAGQCGPFGGDDARGLKVLEAEADRRLDRSKSWANHVSWNYMWFFRAQPLPVLLLENSSVALPDLIEPAVFRVVDQYDVAAYGHLEPCQVGGKAEIDIVEMEAGKALFVEADLFQNGPIDSHEQAIEGLG